MPSQPSKAESLLAVIADITPGKYISWPVYDGKDPLDAKTVQDYVTAFFRTATLMPIPLVKLGLDIHSVQTEYDDQKHHYLITLEGTVRKFKEETK